MEGTNANVRGVKGYSPKMIGSISVFGQLPTYPSPNPMLTLTCYQLTVVELGDGQVGSCPDNDIDPNDLKMISSFQLHTLQIVFKGANSWLLTYE